MQRTVSGISVGHYPAGPSSITLDKKAIEQSRQRAEIANTNKAGADTTAAQVAEPSRAAMLAQTVDFANTVAERFNTRLSFNFDERTGQVVVRVKEGSTEEVIRQIPPEHMIELAATFKHQLRGLILNHQG